MTGLNRSNHKERDMKLEDLGKEQLQVERARPRQVRFRPCASKSQTMSLLWPCPMWASSFTQALEHHLRMPRE
jgi:hypothetical protein